MCGVKPCRKCAAKKRGIGAVKKRKKMARRQSAKNLTGQLTSVALAAGGYILADQVNKLPFVSSNPQIGNFVKLGLGTYLAMTSRNPMFVSAAQGMALNGAIGVGKQYGVVSGVGQIGISRYGANSSTIPGVAGGNGSIIVR